MLVTAQAYHFDRREEIPDTLLLRRTLSINFIQPRRFYLLRPGEFSAFGLEELRLAEICIAEVRPAKVIPLRSASVRIGRISRVDRLRLSTSMRVHLRIQKSWFPLSGT